MKEENVKLVKDLAEQVKAKKEPVILHELEKLEGELYLGELNDADKYQVVLRHLDRLERLITAGINQNTLILTNIYIIMKERAKKEGIDITLVDKE